MELIIKRMILGPVRTNCYIIVRKGSDKAIIVDPGDESSEIEIVLTKMGVEPTAILLTHGHFDHIGAVNTLKSHFALTVYACEKEKELMQSEKNLGSMIGESISVAADEYVNDGQEICIDGIHFKVIYTPGHTIGSVCYYIDSEKILFSGDTLFFHSHGRTDFPTGSQSAIIRSIKDKIMLLKDETTVYPGHEEETTVGNERDLYDYN